MLEARRLLFILVCLIALPASSDQGEESDQPEQTFVIQAEKISPFQPASGFTEIIEIEEISSFSSAAEVLSHATAVQVRRMGGLGSFGAASIRGSTPEQVPVYLDGVLLNAGGFEAVDLSRLPAGLIGEIVLLRGPGASYFGGPGGAIQIKSRRSERDERQFTVGAGSFGAWSGVGFFSFPLGKGRIFTGASLEGARGDFLYLNRNGTLFEPADDVIQKRTNNNHISASALSSWEYQLGEWKNSLAVEAYYRTQGLAGIENLPTKKAHFQCGRESARAEFSRTWSNVLLQVHAEQLYLFEELTDLEGAHGELGLGRQHTIARTHTAAGAIQLNGESLLGLVGGRIETRYEQLNNEDLLNAEQPGSKRRLQFSAGLEDRLQPWEHLEITPSVRLYYLYSWYKGGPLPGQVGVFPSTLRGDLSWQAALALAFRPLDLVTLKVNMARTLRHPSLAELFGDRGAAIGNPDLKPEEAWLADAGVVLMEKNRGTFTRLRLEAAFFSSWAQNLIVWVQNSQSSVRPENVQRSRTLGFETSVRLKMLGFLELEANYTFLDARNLSPTTYLYGKHLPGRPVHQAYGRLNLEAKGKRWRTVLWFDADYAGSNFLDQANLKEDVLARLLFGAGIRLQRPEEGFSLDLEVRNLLDTYILSDARGMKRPLRDFETFPLPGRTVFVTWTQKL